MNLKKKIFSFALAFLFLMSFLAVVPYGSLGADAVDSPRKTLVPGGTPFGVKLFFEGVMVIGISDVDTQSKMVSPSREAGFLAGDVIQKANGKSLSSVDELGDIIQKSGGKQVEMVVNRNGKQMTLTVKPVKSTDGDYKTGLWVKDSTAGIGTVSYIDPESDTFGGLGHGICDGETGQLIPIKRGVVVDVNINGVVKGRVNEPGELKGSFSPVRRGNLVSNTECGVFGTINTTGMELDRPIEIGYKNEVQTGKATVITTVSNQRQFFDAEIERITDKNGKTKNFIIKITDSELLDVAGGIVQGMSGSPIIQNGRIIGAVTHVMIGDPTRGYGIFIENMLNTAQMPMARAS